MAQLNFDASEVPTMDNFDPIPAGSYLAIISDSEMKPTNKGDGNYLKLTFEVVQEGEYQGRKVWSQLNLDNPNPTAVQIAMRELSSICHAAGKLQVNDSSELHNVPMVIKVKIKQEPGRNPQNQITGYEAAGGDAPTATSAPVQQTAAPKGPATPPTRPAQSPFAGRPAGAPAASPSAARAWGKGS